MLKGKKVTLRLLEEKDIELIYKWIISPDTMPFWTGRDNVRTFIDVKEQFTSILNNDENTSVWIIMLHSDPIGYMYITPTSTGYKKPITTYELDIIIGEKNEWGKGYGSDALQIAITYLFEEKAAERIFLVPRADNQRAINVYEKVGFKKEGIIRHMEQFEGNWTDGQMMSILREEYINDLKQQYDATN